MGETVFDLLYRSMSERWRPDDVAKVLLDRPPVRWTDSESVLLRKAARGAYWGTPAWDRYGAPGFASHAVSLTLLDRHPTFALTASRMKKATGQAERIGVAVAALRRTLRCADRNGDSFRWDRQNGTTRRTLGLRMSRRQYNKLFRILRALLRKRARVDERGKVARLLRVAKSGLSLEISRNEFGQSRPAAAFIAYYTARRQRQSVFTNKGQSPAWDVVSEALFLKVRRGTRVPWRALALAAPLPDVLGACAAKYRLGYVARLYAELLDAARLLSGLWKALYANQTTMTVGRGMNSSDWNAIAGAWNVLRSAWLTGLSACGRLADLERVCPGKVMRLMAADVVAWHRASGGTEDPNTAVFAALPLPWDVVLGEAVCTATHVRRACKTAKLDPDQSGWLAPKLAGVPVTTEPTPALVHGVAVGDPKLAELLRRAGWFSGKRIRADVPGVEVERDKDGFALSAKTRPKTRKRKAAVPKKKR